MLPPLHPTAIPGLSPSRRKALLKPNDAAHKTPPEPITMDKGFFISYDSSKRLT
jgi:hypothetical protein